MSVGPVTSAGVVLRREEAGRRSRLDAKTFFLDISRHRRKIGEAAPGDLDLLRSPSYELVEATRNQTNESGISSATHLGNLTVGRDLFSGVPYDLPSITGDSWNLWIY